MPIEGSGNGDMSFQNAFTEAAGEPPVAPEATPATPTAPAPEPVASPEPIPAAAPPTPEPPPAAAPSEPPQSIVAQRAAQAGLDVTGKTDEQIFNEMADGFTQMRPYAQWGQQLAPHYDAIQEYFQQQEAPPARHADAQPSDEWSAPKYFQEKWPAPAWDPQFDVAITNNMVRRNTENGLWEPAPGFEQMTMAIVPKMNEVLTHSEQQWRDLTRANPYERFHDVLLEPMRRQWMPDIERIVNERIAQIESERETDSFERQNADWLYATNEQGQRVFTPHGEKFYTAIERLKQFNPQATPDQLLKYAVDLVGIPSKEQTPTSSVQPPTPAAAAASPPQPQQTPQQLFLQNARDRAMHSASAGGFTQQDPESHPVNVGETELNNMFISAALASEKQ